MDNKARQAKHLPYHYDDPSLMGNQMEYMEKLYSFNQTHPTDQKRRQQLLGEMFANIGPDCHVEPPLHANWGGHHVHFGRGIYANFNLTLVDDADIYIGNLCMFGPNVVIATSGHPVLPILREHHYVYNFPVHLGNNVWVGANVTILPGVTIGDNTVIGAGSVVTHDIPADTVAFGVPCEAVRPIGEKDRQFYFKNHRLDVES